MQQRENIQLAIEGGTEVSQGTDVPRQIPRETETLPSQSTQCKLSDDQKINRISASSSSSNVNQSKENEVKVFEQAFDDDSDLPCSTFEQHKE